MKKRKFYFLILIVLMLYVLTACTNESKEDLQIQKGLSEIKFLDNQCTNIFNNYISGLYKTKDNQVDWNLIRNDYSILRSSIDVILIDFASLQIPSKDVVGFENSFNDLDMYLQNEDVNGFFGKLCDTYSFIVNNILESISKDEILKLEKKAKTETIYIGYNLTVLNKIEALARLERLQEIYNELNKNQEYLENNSYKINRILINIQRLRAMIEQEEWEQGLFHITSLQN